jgi:hypothetical protein
VPIDVKSAFDCDFLNQRRLELDNCAFLGNIEASSSHYLARNGRAAQPF